MAEFLSCLHHVIPAGPCLPEATWTGSGIHSDCKSSCCGSPSTCTSGARLAGSAVCTPGLAPEPRTTVSGRKWGRLGQASRPPRALWCPPAPVSLKTLSLSLPGRVVSSVPAMWGQLKCDDLVGTKTEARDGAKSTQAVPSKSSQSS